MDMKKITISHKFDYYVLLFFSISFLGWVWEVVLYFFTKHALINRGVYRGPYLPVYGVGGLLLCLFFGSMKKRPIRVFFLSAVLCCLLEYFTSYFLELRFGIRWWDYSGHFLNIGGRICLLGAVAFGLGGAALVCLYLPFYDEIYGRISEKWRVLLCFLFLAVFVADGAYCAMRPNMGEGISEDAFLYDLNGLWQSFDQKYLCRLPGLLYTIHDKF